MFLLLHYITILLIINFVQIFFSSHERPNSFADVLAFGDFQSISFFIEINTAAPEENWCGYAPRVQRNKRFFSGR